MAIINSPKGTHDILGDEARGYAHIINVCEEVATLYGYQPIQTPIFEANELFARGVGDATDIVRKEMYVFKDKGDRLNALRPEGTAGVMRSIIANKLHATNDLPLRYFYSGPMFRYERPQLGRYRQFHQFGVESVGVTSVYDDLEVILLAIHALQALGFETITTRINSLSTRETRETYKEALKRFYADHLDHVCVDCKVRYEQNPLRMLDCKVPEDVELSKKAPRISDFLTVKDKKDLDFIKNALLGFNIETNIDTSLVRGLDYYSGIIFEFEYVPASGKNYGAIGGGGRYDKLVSDLGGPALKGVGFAFGLERLYHILHEEGKLDHVKVVDDLYIISVGETARYDAFSLLTSLRTNGVRAITNFTDKSFKSLFKIAENRGAKYALIIGENEVNNQVVSVRNLETQEQTEVKYQDITYYMLDLLGFHSHSHDHDHDHDGCCGHGEEEGHDCHCQDQTCDCECGQDKGCNCEGGQSDCDCDCKTDEKCDCQKDAKEDKKCHCSCGCESCADCACPDEDCDCDCGQKKARPTDDDDCGCGGCGCKK